MSVFEGRLNPSISATMTYRVYSNISKHKVLHGGFSYVQNIVLPAIFTPSLLTGHAFASDHAHKAPGTININTTSAEIMDDKLKFVGERTAERIVKSREAKGNIKNES